MSKKELLFSLTKKDFRVDTFRSGGKGGQHQNTRDTGVRITHLASGAVGEARDSRYQQANKQNAFKRLIASDVFQKWYKLECARRLGQADDIETKVDELMDPKNIKIEVVPCSS